jgi:hypothetical protein
MANNSDSPADQLVPEMPKMEVNLEYARCEIDSQPRIETIERAWATCRCLIAKISFVAAARRVLLPIEMHHEKNLR